jgi:hypothetical protein
VPRFYFDIDDGKVFLEDMDGLELASIEEAKAEGQKALAEVAKDALPDGDHRDFQATIRGENGEQLLRVKLLLRVEDLSAMPED